ncbi:MAG: Protein containing Lytic transglycosylase-like, catalytic-like protein [Candidatus Woesebacteria bacterium GW2011_GWB1_38_5b]|uniref:Protein containing Lytic transglycosylase-like, catalytic-like protein n=1 Tax=Candidatus Woesebacteria bacterium GW2011_GWB1_38_5b TaxID=1618569 RepID=A0A0G0KIZ4_9BACT|nr:MAG: Protein containing Lytic transglycosylase-like, catalytic-like protein [Candidatus Woesebacteria bacterium GW2011_GWB1_38_5b]
MRIVSAFLIGFVPTFIGFIGASNIFEEPKAVVLAEQIEVTPQPTSVETQTPSPRSMPSATAGKPTPTPDVWSPPDITSMFVRYANVYSVDQNILERLANCESHFNPQAVNRDYLGMFQFSTNTWVTNRQQMGFDANPVLRTNIEESIRTAAYLLSKRGVSPWPACI